MKKSFLLFLLFATFFNCSQNQNEQGKDDFADGTYEEGEKKIEEKKIKGDTSSLSIAELEKLLPSSVNGYKKEGEIIGNSTNEAGNSFATVEQWYSSGSNKLKITIADYNGAYGLYAGALAAFSTQIESDEEKAGTVKLKGGKVEGWESINFNSKEATLMAASQERFIITLLLTNQEKTEEVKAIFEKLSF